MRVRPKGEDSKSSMHAPDTDLTNGTSSVGKELGVQASGNMESYSYMVRTIQHTKFHVQKAGFVQKVAKLRYQTIIYR